MSLLGLRREVAVPVGINTETFNPSEPFVAVKKASGGYVYFNILFQTTGFLDRLVMPKDVKTRRKVSLDVMTDPKLIEALHPYGNPISIHSKHPDFDKKIVEGNVIPWKRLHLREYHEGDNVFYAPTTVH
ncbi:hypothetical protein D3C87_1598530 [compost metagenome]|jgi:hypothetical protein